MTPDEKRALLKRYMSECAACVPDDADAVADDKLEEWLVSHGWPDIIPESERP
jgi:hypothetical protein